MTTPKLDKKVIFMVGGTTQAVSSDGKHSKATLFFLLSGDPEDPKSWKYIVNDADRPKTACFSSKPARNLGSVGTVFQLDASDEDATHVSFSSPRYLGRWPDKAKVVELQAKEDARQQVERAKKECKRRLDYEALEPFARAYVSMYGEARAQLIARVVARIVNGGSP